MKIKLNQNESLFRNELIFTVDAKAVNIDNTLVNLFMLLRHNGQRPRQKARAKADIDINLLKRTFGKLEEEGAISGYQANPIAAELWMRSNLVNMVSRGKPDREKISSLRPIHLESYRVRNVRNTRDYNTADQVYLMLGVNPTVKEDLKNFLIEGWDKTTGKISIDNQLDVDSLGLLNIINKVSPGYIDSASHLNQIEPLLEDQAHLFCDDVRRLLVYKRLIPRNVLIDYLKTITSFHLSLYAQKLIHLLPTMVAQGSLQIDDDWHIIVDATDNFESKMAPIAIAQADRLFNSVFDYIKATFQINAALRYLGLDQSDSAHLTRALETLGNRPDDFETYFKVAWNNIYSSLEDEEDKRLVNEMVKYENTYFDQYIELILKVRGPYQYQYHVQLLDNVSQKNNERGFMAQGRSKKHPRRFVLGTRLLETIVQILVLHQDQQFVTRSLSIEELVSQIAERYGLFLNGSEEEFADAGLNTHLAFKENMDAFKLKLRQIGFYNDLSDAYLLQKIRPRYTIDS